MNRATLFARNWRIGRAALAELRDSCAEAGEWPLWVVAHLTGWVVNLFVSAYFTAKDARTKMGILLVALSIFYGHAHADTPNQGARWRAARLDPRRSIELDKAVALYQRTAARYQAVASSGVPPVIVFCLHYREASNAFNCSLAQGDPLTHRSRNVPAGRIPGKLPPYTWEECALDALALDKMGAKDWASVDGTFNACEGYNGWGVWLYHRRETPSGYITAGTSLYVRGKYSADGRWDRTAVDRQLGVMAIIKRFQERGIAPPFL